MVAWIGIEGVLILEQLHESAGRPQLVPSHGINIEVLEAMIKG